MIDYKIVDNILEVLDSKGKTSRSIKIIPLKYVYSIEISDINILFHMPNNTVDEISVFSSGFKIFDIHEPWSPFKTDEECEKIVNCFREFAEDVKTKWLECINA